MTDDDAPDDVVALGTCCICGSSDRVYTIIMLPLKCDVRGHGWGCAQCGLSNDGASAVLCERCVVPYQRGERRLLIACRGYPGSDGRIPIDQLMRVHEHNPQVDHNG